MPELPEVETIKRSLVPFLEGAKIIDVEILFAGLIKKPSPVLFREQIKGKTILSLKRRGKYLLFFLEGGLILVIHLRMTGQLLVCERDVPWDKYTRLVFSLASQMECRFSDPRKFGLAYLLVGEDWAAIPGLNHLGPEPLSSEFTPTVLAELLKGRQGKIKPFLLDQRRIAGIGNIYADEILFRAEIHPERRINTLCPGEITALFTAIKTILKEAILYRGTSWRDYVDGRGEEGGFQERLRVYGRKGKPCSRCQSSLQRIVVAGRGTVFCPCCQKLISSI